MPIHLRFQERLDPPLLLAVDVYLRLQNRHESRLCYLDAVGELLLDNLMDSLLIITADNGTHLRSEYVALLCPLKESIQPIDRLH